MKILLLFSALPCVIYAQFNLPTLSRSPPKAKIPAEYANYFSIQPGAGFITSFLPGFVPPPNYEIEGQYNPAVATNGFGGLPPGFNGQNPSDAGQNPNFLNSALQSFLQGGESTGILGGNQLNPTPNKSSDRSSIAGIPDVEFTLPKAPLQVGQPTAPQTPFNPLAGLPSGFGSSQFGSSSFGNGPAGFNPNGFTSPGGNFGNIQTPKFGTGLQGLQGLIQGGGQSPWQNPLQGGSSSFGLGNPATTNNANGLPGGFGGINPSGFGGINPSAFGGINPSAFGGINPGGNAAGGFDLSSLASLGSLANLGGAAGGLGGLAGGLGGLGPGGLSGLNGLSSLAGLANTNNLGGLSALAGGANGFSNNNPLGGAANPWAGTPQQSQGGGNGNFISTLLQTIGLGGLSPNLDLSNINQVIGLANIDNPQPGSDVISSVLYNAFTDDAVLTADANGTQENIGERTANSNAALIQSLLTQPSSPFCNPKPAPVTKFFLDAFLGKYYQVLYSPPMSLGPCSMITFSKLSDIGNGGPGTVFNLFEYTTEGTPNGRPRINSGYGLVRAPGELIFRTSNNPNDLNVYVLDVGPLNHMGQYEYVLLGVNCNYPLYVYARDPIKYKEKYEPQINSMLEQRGLATSWARLFNIISPVDYNLCNFPPTLFNADGF